MWLVAVEAYISRTVFIIVRILFFVFFIRFFIFEFGIVSGPSMEPRFRDGSVFMVMKAPYYVRAPERFDVVQFVNPENEQRLLIKRVIGLPGEIVSIKRNQVCIRKPSEPNDQCYNEPYLLPGTVTRDHGDHPNGVYLEPDMYFLMGDNRLVSFDSRDLGPINRKNILGLILPL